MTKVLCFDETTDPPASDGEGLTELWAEIDQIGWVVREIGFAADGTIRHKRPGDGPYGRFGVFDLARISHSVTDFGVLAVMLGLD